MKLTQLFVATMIAFSPVYAFENDFEVGMTSEQDVDNGMDSSTGTANSTKAKIETDQGTNQFPTKDHQDAYNNLSEKNQNAYDGLEEHEQDQVAETYKNGGNHQKTLSEILSDDQKQHNQNQQASGKVPKNDQSVRNSPATKAMQKQVKPKETSEKGNVFSN